MPGMENLPTMPKSQVSHSDPFEWCRGAGRVTLPPGGTSHVPLHVMRFGTLETQLR